MRSKLKLGIHCFASDDTFLIDGIRIRLTEIGDITIIK
jgi:hypothetical protein